MALRILTSQGGLVGGGKGGFRGSLSGGALGALLLGGLACSGNGGEGPAPGPASISEETVGFQWEFPSEPVRASQAMVVSANALASQVGVEVMRAGGNAVDAAVATAFALAVVHPTAGNIGGGGFMVIRFPDGTATTIDFREKAPLAAHPRMFLDQHGRYSPERHRNSHLAVGVPGTVAGLSMAHRKYGRASWAELVDPAVRLAEDGFALSEALARSFRSVLRSMERYPASLAVFSKNGVPFEAGEVWRQPDLARTLRRIRDHRETDFYAGETARLLVEEMERGGGLITMEDLARYEAVERPPIVGNFRGYEIVSMGPPSSGGIALIQMLNILEGFLLTYGHNHPRTVHLMVEAMRRAYRDRARYLADADHYPVPLEQLVDKIYCAALRREIDPDRASPSSPQDVRVPDESPETTHFSVVDSEGMAVAVTYTLEAGYGSKIVVPGAGFLLNNEMGDFNPAPGMTDEEGNIGSEPNLARPGQRMLSSMTPTIVAWQGKLVAVTGSPGGRTIINTVLQVILNLVDHRMNVQEAVNARRFHHQWLPDLIQGEEGAFTPETVAALEAMGHRVRMRGTQGRAHTIMIDPVSGERLGAPDYRDRDAGARGY